MLIFLFFLPWKYEFPRPLKEIPKFLFLIHSQSGRGLFAIFISLIVEFDS